MENEGLSETGVMKNRINRSHPGRLLAFFVLAYGITWGLSLFATPNVLPFTLPAAFVNISGILLHYGPAIAAMIVVGIAGGRRGVYALLGSLRHWRVGAGWYLFVFSYPLLLRLAVVSINVLLGGKLPDFFSSAFAPAGNPIVLLPAVFLAVFFQAGLAEEIGWRGYALPALQKRYSALAASLILGIIWAIWHFHPLNFNALWPNSLWYLIHTLAFTIIFTWVYNNTQGSLLLAVLFHTVSNVSDWIIPTLWWGTEAGSVFPFIIQSLLMWATAIGIIIAYGPKYLSRKAHLEA